MAVIISLSSSADLDQPAGQTFFGFGRSTGTSRNSSGPLIRRRFRLAFSSLLSAPADKLSIARDARSAIAARCRSEGSDLVFTVSPISTSRRTATRTAEESVMNTGADHIGSGPARG
jgi:hypothetical protein